MVLGYVGGAPTVDAEWHVWYQGEWETNKLDIAALDASNVKMNAIPVLSQQHPMAYGTAGGIRTLGCASASVSGLKGAEKAPLSGIKRRNRASPRNGAFLAPAVARRQGL
ncbi:MAG: hypothetical protein GXX91_04435 [Verrucomicrobiaceae bacterium]|nr:hypothetical protein [Verrucomicrobiaceae bacterium]